MLSADFKPFCSNIYKFCGLFTLPFFTFLPNVAIELTENQCQSVNPWAKGSPPPPPPPLFHTQGVQAAHPVLHQRRHWMRAGDIDLGRQIDVQIDVPAEFITRCYSTLPRFDSMVVDHATFPKTGFPQLLSAAVVQPRFCGQVNRLFNNFHCADPVTLRFPHSF